MLISTVRRLCPHAVYLPVNYKLYREVSSRITEILRGCVDRFEQGGIDEAFLDVVRWLGVMMRLKTGGEDKT